jgi:peroxiredoxin
MNKRWLPPLAILAAGLAGAVYFEIGSREASNFPAPDFALPDLDGRVHRLSDFRGKLVFLNVWTTWCPPCRMEMPLMERLYQRLQGRDFVMLAVSQDEAGVSTVRAFVEQMKLSFPVLVDPAGIVSTRYGVTGYPETFLIDQSGNVIERIIGPENWESDRSYQRFAALLDGGTARSDAPAGRGG